MQNGLRKENKNITDILYLIDKTDFNLSPKRVQEDLTKAMVKYFDSDSGQFCLHNHENAATKEKTALYNLSWEYTDQYIAYYHQLDSFLQVSPALNSCRDGDLNLPTSRRRMEFFSDFIRPQKISHLLVLYIRDNNRIVGHIGIHRYGANATFSQKDLLQADFLAATFSHKLKQHQLLDKARNLEHLLKKVINISSTGILILDTNLCPIYWNKEVLELGATPINQEMEIRETDGVVPVLPPEIFNECKRLQKSFSAGRRINHIDSQAVFRGNRKYPINVEIKLLPADPVLKDGMDSCYYVITFNRIQRIYNNQGLEAPCDVTLTPKETEIVHYICQGLSNKEIGQNLFISLPTVSTHISHIFQKLGINSRSKLIYSLRH